MARGKEEAVQEINRTSGAGAGPTAFPGVIKMCETLYSIQAPQIELLSNLDPASQASSIVTISALGNEEMDGDVWIYGADSAHLAGGSQSYLHLKTEEEVTGSVTLDCGTAGTLTLQSGLTQEPNHLVMNPEGITVSSLEKMLLQVLENSLTMTPEGITIQSGESVIELTPEGITLTVGPNVIEITAEGITVNGATLTLTGDAETSVSGASLELTGEADISITAPAVSIS
jgi:hypothetical protein